METPAPHFVDHNITDSPYVTILCAVVVMFYAARKFNTPETNRTSTTRLLFFLTGAGYVVTSLALFLLLCVVVLRPGVLPFLGLENFQKAVADYAAPPVLAAVLLTTLLPNTVVVSAADAWLLQQFHAWGRIPQGVRNLADRLTLDSLRVNDAEVGDIRNWIFGYAGLPNEIAGELGVDAADTPRGSLTRTVRLFRELHDLAKLPAYIEPFRYRQRAWDSIETNFKVYVAESQAFFVLFEKLSRLDGAAGQGALKEAEKYYSEIGNKIHRQMTEFLAQTLLIVEPSESRIDSRLQSMGYFPAEEAYLRLDVGPILFMGFLMTVAMLAIVAIALPHGPSALPLPMIAILIGATRTIGVLTAVLPKLRKGKPRAATLPYLQWLEWAFVAGVLSFLVERTAIAMAHQAIAAEVDFSDYPLSPMAPLAFATSLSIAVLCDLDLRLGQGWARRLADGVLCAVVMSFAMFICVQLLALTPATEGRAPPWLPLAVSSSLGFLCGFIVPDLYRRARKEESPIRMISPQLASVPLTSVVSRTP
ncbi:hypothetical protein DFR50_10823 [Roseiarcus fermentans]|uniref:Uncharacterized protein n=1 Tax=Roseiarcus fermentans TaxID=1473586 RepID=A0A366FLK3_9HYPH|nr:hypothetical protein [Roseiarcus fermentans]RBP15467.1 hypothetical protein DFR50_10823 [Roseiarcus fermentans]